MNIHAVLSFPSWKQIIITFTFFTCFHATFFAQVAINTNSANPHPTAMLDISSTTRGLLIPRMSFGEMSAIVSPAEGLLVYVNSGATGLYQYRSGNWEKLFSFNGTLSNGGVLFGLNGTFSQSTNHFFWNEAQKYLGLGTNTPNAPLTVSSLLPPTGNGGNSNWIVANIGASTGSRLLFGTREGLPTIGAANAALLAWDTLSLNPGGPLKLSFYANQNPRVLSTNANGAVVALKAANGLQIRNDSIQLGSALQKNTFVDLNNKNLSFRGGSLSPVMTINNDYNTNISTNTNTSFGQAFVVQSNGILNKVSIRMGSDAVGFTGAYYLYEGSGYGGALLQSGNVYIPNYGYSGLVDLVLNQTVVGGQTYTLRIGALGNWLRFDLVANNLYPAAPMYFNSSPDFSYDLRFQVFETEALFDLMKIDGQTKTISIKGQQSKLTMESLSGTGTRNVVATSDGTLISTTGVPGTVSNVTTTSPLQVVNGSTTPQISITQANGSTNGFLSSADWTTFNNKQNALPNAGPSTSGILTSSDWNTFNNKVSATTAVNTTAPLTGGGTLGTSLNLSMTQASASVNGFLSSTDWNTFNNKFNLPSLTAGSLLFSNGTTIEQNNANLFWNNTTKALGIGTSTPVAGLHLKDYEWNDALRITNRNAGTVGPGVYLEGANRSFAIISTNSASGAGAQKLGIYDDKAAQYRMVIDSTGNIGVGEINPDKKLVVNGTGGLRVSSSHPGNGYSDWVAADIGGTGDQRVVIGQFDNIATIGAHNAALNSWRNLAINPLATGNVGIGTPTPEYKLDVNGSQRVTGSLTVTGHVKQSVQQLNISVPGASYPVINPLIGGSTTPTYGESTAIWVHNLGYNPVIMTSFDFTAGNHLHHVHVSYRHADENTIEFYFSNQSVTTASGLLNIIVVN